MVQTQTSAHGLVLTRFCYQPLPKVVRHRFVYVSAECVDCGNKMPTKCNRWFLLQDLIACSTCFGHHYAHHQELGSIIQVVAACGICCYGFQIVGMVCSWGLCVWFAYITIHCIIWP